MLKFRKYLSSVFIILVSFAGSSFAESFSLNWGLQSSNSVFSHEELHNLPYRSVEEILLFEHSVVEMRDRQDFMSANEIELHVRGGREYENAFFLNGVNVTDPISGIYTAGFNTRAFSLLEFYSGGFPSKYGNANAGIIEMTTFNGNDRISAYAELYSDNDIGSDFDKNDYLLALNGPIPITENLTFFAMVEHRWLDDRYPSWITNESLPTGQKRLPANWLDGWTYHGKLRYEINNMSFTAHLDGSNTEWSEYLQWYYFNSEHTPYHDDDNLSLGLKFEHEIEPGKTGYSLRLSHFSSKRFAGDGVYRKNLWGYGRPMGNPGNDVTNLFVSGDRETTDITYQTIPVEGEPRQFTVGGDEGHVFNNYLKHDAEVMTFSGEINNTFNEMFGATAGFEYKRHTIRYYEHYFPTRVYEGLQGGGFLDVVNYGYDDFGNESNEPGWENSAKHPVNWAVRLDNKFYFESLEITPAVRLDVFDVDALVLRNQKLPLDPDSLVFDSDPQNDILASSLEQSDLKEVDSYVRFSPRLSIKAPVSERTTVFSNFGVYYQMVPFQYLYTDYAYMEYKIQTGGYYVAFGNSSLEPIKTKLFEAGIKHRLNRYLEFSATAYIKDEENHIQVYNQPSFPTSFATFRNFEDARVEGLETEVILYPNGFTKIQLGYTWTESKGGGSYPNEQSNIAWVNVAPPTDSPPLIFDQRHKIVGVASIDLSGISANNRNAVFSGLKLNVIARAGSGHPYTPIQIVNEASLGPYAYINLVDRNAERTQWNSSIDLSLEKTMNVGGFEITPFGWVTNLFDNENVAHVWNTTGEPGNVGWLSTSEGQQFVQSYSNPDYTGLNGQQKYEMRQMSPDNYFSPRQFYFGVKVKL